jgi:hypothetical protein
LPCSPRRNYHRECVMVWWHRGPHDAQ